MSDQSTHIILLIVFKIVLYILYRTLKNSFNEEKEIKEREVPIVPVTALELVKENQKILLQKAILFIELRAYNKLIMSYQTFDEPKEFISSYEDVMSDVHLAFSGFEIAGKSSGHYKSLKSNLIDDLHWTFGKLAKGNLEIVLTKYFNRLNKGRLLSLESRVSLVEVAMSDFKGSVEEATIIKCLRHVIVPELLKSEKKPGVHSGSRAMINDQCCQEIRDYEKVQKLPPSIGILTRLRNTAVSNYLTDEQFFDLSNEHTFPSNVKTIVKRRSVDVLMRLN